MIDQFFRTILFGKNDVKKDVNLDPWIQSVCVCVCVEFVLYLCSIPTIYFISIYNQILDRKIGDNSFSFGYSDSAINPWMVGNHLI